MFSPIAHSQTPNSSPDTLLRIDRFGRIFSDSGSAQSNRATLGAGALLVQRQDVGVACLVSLFGALDHNTAPAFVDLIDWLQTREHRTMHLDLTGLRIVDVTGMDAIDGLKHVAVLLESEALVQLRRLVEGIEALHRHAA